MQLFDRYDPFLMGQPVWTCDAGLDPAAILRNLAPMPSHAQFMLQCAKVVAPPSQ
ncbi:hypothetical protein [Xanthomonas vasicola]|uniref:hypothetical protein n=1 Tax=Xanthomonas vasicola TaxID=56459 RepID=UPI0001CC001D